MEGFFFGLGGFFCLLGTSVGCWGDEMLVF